MGINTVLLSAKSAGIVPLLQHMFVCVEQNLRTQSFRTPFKSCTGFHQGQSRFLLCGHELVKLVSVDFPAGVVRNFPPRIARYSHIGGVSDLRRVPERLCPNTTTVSCPIHLHFPEGGRLHRQQREGRALASWSARREDQACTSPRHCLFSVCVRGRLRISSSRSAILTRVRLAMIWQSPWKSMHSKEIGSKYFPTSAHASQHRIGVARCLFL